MERSAVNLYNQFESLRAQVDCLNESIEPRKLFPRAVLVFVTCLEACPRKCGVYVLIALSSSAVVSC